MILCGILGTIIWIRSRRWFKGYKYLYRLLIRIIIQLCIVGLISILSATIVSPPRLYGEISIFLPLSYPVLLQWGISGYMVYPPIHYYTISVLGIDFTGGALEFGASAYIQGQIFMYSIPLLLLLNLVFTGVLLLLSELWKVFFSKK
ncbi:MAG: hypothetical protein EAX91_04570 [Candidatus Lokiarchaeota archaeon]|nr:hypothetical protein [Candidatus Lokiarchaeota archaeon]